jgi:hypothetical protein
VTDSPSSIVDMDDGSKRVQSSTASLFFFQNGPFTMDITIQVLSRSQVCARSLHTQLESWTWNDSICTRRGRFPLRCSTNVKAKLTPHRFLFHGLSQTRLPNNNNINNNRCSRISTYVYRVIKDLNRVVVDLIYKTDNNFYIFIRSINNVRTCNTNKK